MKHERIYLTPANLGITPLEHDSLVALADDLAAGRIAHVRWDEDHDDVDFGGRDMAESFNMDYTCGTACCIGGWLRFRGVLSQAGVMALSLNIGVLAPLFYPDLPDADGYEFITPAQAAAAIRNFLASGEPRWAEVVDK